MRAFLADLRLAARTLSRMPGFTAAGVLVLGLGLGAGATVFSAVDAVLFRPLPVPEPERLVRVFASNEEHRDLGSTSYPVFRDYAEQARSFSGIAAYASNVPVNVSAGSEPPTLARAAVVSGSFFGTVGIRPLAGRLLGPEDERAAQPVAVLTEDAARRRYGALEAAPGASLRINAHLYTVVGVAPRSFTGVDLETAPDVYLPAAMAERAMPGLAGLSLLTSRSVGWADLVARLAPSVTLAQAQDELDGIARRRAASQPTSERDPYAFVLPAARALVAGDVEPSSPAASTTRLSWLLLGAGALVVLLAGAVLAGLLAVRAERRRAEIAVRLAIGASRSALVRQLLAESVVLAFPAAALGLAAAAATATLVRGAAVSDVQLPLAAATPVLAWRVAGTITAVALLASALFGLLPALRATRRELAPSLKGDARTTTGPRRLSLGGAFVIFQVALAAVLLAGAGLLLRTLQRMTAVDPGFPVDGAAVADLDVARGGMSKELGARRLAEVLERVRALPGVTAAGLMRSVPVQRRGMRATVEIAGFTPPPGTRADVDFDVVTPGAVTAVGIPLVRGRDFTGADDEKAPRVAIVNEAFVRRYWPGQDGLGKLLDKAAQGRGVLIVGVAKDVSTHSLREAPAPLLLVPHAQLYFPGVSLVARTRPGAEAALLTALRAAVAAVDKDLSVFAPRTLRQHVGAMLGKERLLAGLLSSFGALALLLASFGLFGVLSFATEARRREIGIRIALGAEARDVARLVTSQGARLAAAGLATGSAASLVLARVLTHLLFGVSPQDPLTLLGVAVLLALAALLACAVPALRASRVDPITALRTE
jgi:putative ABC transport system permease protein